MFSAQAQSGVMSSAHTHFRQNDALTISFHVTGILLPSIIALVPAPSRISIESRFCTAAADRRGVLLRASAARRLPDVLCHLLPVVRRPGSGQCTARVVTRCTIAQILATLYIANITQGVIGWFVELNMVRIAIGWLWLWQWHRGCDLTAAGRDEPCDVAVHVAALHLHVDWSPASPLQ